jgi:metal-dependent amidase/aminoacylase/carboxypeptidase family protein
VSFSKLFFAIYLSCGILDADKKEGITMQTQYITKEIEKHILDIAHTIHRHPEISYEEFETTDLLREELEKLNLEFTQQQPVTGVIALLRGGLPGPTIALRADIDALPVP